MNNRILALDQATKVSGWSIWEDGQLTEYGHISFDNENPFTRNHRLIKWLANMIEVRKPDLVVIEDIQMQANNVATFQKLAQLQGAIIEFCISHDLDYKISRPVEWRAVCNFLKDQDKHRDAQKKIAQQWVQNTFGHKCIQDEADAICIGYAAWKGIENDYNWEDEE